MADEPIRVLFRFVGGLPARQASKEERSKLGDLAAQNWEKWKASGVKLIGSFSTYGNAVDGFCHHIILEVDDVRKVHENHTPILPMGDPSTFSRRGPGLRFSSYTGARMTQILHGR